MSRPHFEELVQRNDIEGLVRVLNAPTIDDFDRLNLLLAIIEAPEFQPQMIETFISNVPGNMLYLDSGLRHDIVDTIIEDPRARNRVDHLRSLVRLRNVQPNQLKHKLVTATRCGVNDVAEYLLSLGVDVHILHESALTSAIREKGNLETVKLLVAHGADINNPPRSGRGGGSYPTTEAASVGKDDILDYLLRLGAHQTEKSLIHAIRNHHISTAKLLLNHGITVTPVGMQSIIQLIPEFAILQLLVDSGLLTVEHHPLIQQHFLARMIVYNPDLPINKKTRITNLMITAQHGPTYRLQGLIPRSKSIDAQDSYGNTALHYAVESGDLRRVRLLLAGGADPHLKNHLGYSPIDYAEYGSPEMFTLFKVPYAARGMVSQGVPKDVANIVESYRPE